MHLLSFFYFSILWFLKILLCLDSTVKSVIGISYAYFFRDRRYSRYSAVNGFNGMRQSEQCRWAFIQQATSSRMTKRLSRELMNLFSNE